MCCGAQTRPFVPKAVPPLPPPKPAAAPKAVPQPKPTAAPQPRRIPSPQAVMAAPRKFKAVVPVDIGDKSCNLCGWPIKNVKYVDLSTRQVVQARCCTNSKCPNSRIKR